jgi:hypothetical protein
VPRKESIVFSILTRANHCADHLRQSIQPASGAISRFRLAQTANGALSGRHHLAVVAGLTVGEVANLTDDVKMLRSVVSQPLIRRDKCWERRYRDGQSVPNEAGCFGGMCSEEIANG